MRSAEAEEKKKTKKNSKRGQSLDLLTSEMPQQNLGTVLSIKT